jgi:saccharopine dehydrogenase (NAD+, L-lysine-forming)
MAASLASALPSATRLELAFGGGMQPSAGTAKTTVENLHVGALVRENGAIVALPEPRTREVPFASGARFAMSIPWGDIVTAYHSTGIPNITVYMVVPKAAVRGAALLRFAAPVLKLPSVVGFLQRQIEARATGPSEEERKGARMSIWGRVEDDAGHAVEGQLEAPDGYELTVSSALASAERVLSGAVAPGATTPSRAFGNDFVTKLPGVGALSVTHVS